MVTSNDAGQEVVLAYLHPGQGFGDRALREHTLQPLTLRAETDGEVFLIDAGTFGRLLASRLTPCQSPLPPTAAEKPASAHAAGNGKPA